jgi:undecaprenyl-diphosphatase
VTTPDSTSFDTRADALLEPLRESRIAVRVFGAASTIGDFSVVWHLCVWIRAIGSMHRVHQAIALSLALGCESLIVNQGIKRIFKRSRPTTSGDHRFDMRTPSTSSFPSGHASSATFAAIILCWFTGWPLAVLWCAIALVVALSRAVVRIHHMSDVLGGVVTGALLASATVPLLSQILR